MAERRGGANLDSSSEDEGGDVRAQRARQKVREEDSEKRLQAMLRGIERAAGGEIIDVI